MTELPSSIESYLLEAGFTGTEIIVLRRLLEEEALTLREMAFKTGKSTGVLDQAVKKLQKKRIIAREVVNDVPKYRLQSLQKVIQWMEDDTVMKQDMLKRKHESFEQFIRSLTVGKRRPEMQYFEGVDGIKKAYMDLLTLGNDIAQYGPTYYTATEDPLRDFWVQHFRERRRRGIFSRVITHDTPLGRRFQSRDPFEFRRTVLVDPQDYPFDFEKVIIGDTVACFQQKEHLACFIKYPELAQNERIFFERIWNQQIAGAQKQSAASAAEADQKAYEQAMHPTPTSPSFHTQTLSQVRDFFLSRASLVTFAVFGIVAALLTYGLYRHNVNLNTKRVQEKAMSIAATAALQFDAADLNAIHILKDAEKPEYKKMVYQLNLIRNQNPGVKYAYLMRPVQGYIWEYIADADAVDPWNAQDVNENGAIDVSEELNYPGEQFDTNPKDPPLYPALEEPMALPPILDARLGTLISGLAPVKDSNGKAVGIVGIDIDVQSVYEMTNSTFTPILFFFGFIVLFLLVRLAAFNRSLLQDIWQIIRTRNVHITLVGLVAIALLVTYGLYRRNVTVATERIRERALTVVTTAAFAFDARDIDQVRTLEDMEKPAYKKIVQQLKLIELQNQDAKYVYIHRPTGLKNPSWEVVADVETTNYDLNDDGVSEEWEQMNKPGQKYPHEDPYLEEIMQRPFAVLVQDEWGEYWDASAPIYDAEGKAVAALYISFDIQQVHSLAKKNFTPLYWFLGVLALFLLIRLASFNKSLFLELWHLLNKCNVLLLLLLTCMVALAITYGLYRYTLYLKKEEIGKRLMAIAVTTIPRIDPEDVKKIHWKRDMQMEEYQRLFTLLNEVRTVNEGITYAYIMRPTPEEGIWEFVVDADTNYFIPNLFVDMNLDNKLSAADEAVIPGTCYDMEHTSPRSNRDGLLHSIYEESVLPDQWGAFMSAFAPVQEKNGEASAIIGFDIDITAVKKDVWNEFCVIIWVISSFGVIVLCILIFSIVRAK